MQIAERLINDDFVFETREGHMCVVRPWDRYYVIGLDHEVWELRTCRMGVWVCLGTIGFRAWAGLERCSLPAGE